MRKIVGHLNADIAGYDLEVEFEVEDDATDDICDLPVRNIARIPVYKCCPVVGKYKYRISLDMLDFTPLVLFNNYWRQEWMDAVAWQNFLKYNRYKCKKVKYRVKELSKR